MSSACVRACHGCALPATRRFGRCMEIDTSATLIKAPSALFPGHDMAVPRVQCLCREPAGRLAAAALARLLGARSLKDNVPQPRLALSRRVDESLPTTVVHPSVCPPLTPMLLVMLNNGAMRSLLSCSPCGPPPDPHRINGCNTHPDCAHLPLSFFCPPSLPPSSAGILLC